MPQAGFGSAEPQAGAAGSAEPQAGAAGSAVPQAGFGSAEPQAGAGSPAPQEEKAATLFRFSDMVSPFMTAALNRIGCKRSCVLSHNPRNGMPSKEGTNLSPSYQKVSSSQAGR